MSDQIKVILPDGSTRMYDQGSSAMDVAQSISEGLARNVLSAEVNGEVWDADRALPQETHLKLLTWNDEDGKNTFWHSSAHLMAEALESLYPGIKLGIGPPIEKGYYYDVDFGDQEFDAAHLEKIEKKMLELARQKNEYKRIEIGKADAVEYFEKRVTNINLSY